MDITKKFKAKELRKLKEKELLEIMSKIDRNMALWRGVKSMGGDAMAKLPTGSTGGVRWGLFNNMRKNRAIILTVLTENRKGIR
jgi:ribosomal protein L29